MKYVKEALFAAGLAIAAVDPAHATLTVSFWDVGTGTIVSCADGAGCDNGGVVNQVLQINQTVGNFQIVGTFAANNTTTLQSSNLAIFNLSGGADTLRVLVSQNGFSAPVTAIDLAASITFNADVGAAASTMSFYADTNNVVDTFGTLGASLFSVSKAPASPADAQSGTALVAFASNGPFTMSEFAELNFISGSNITNFGQTMVTSTAAVPEPATWGMMLLGFAGIGLYGARKRRQQGLVRLV